MARADICRAYISVGSNIDREGNVATALDALFAVYGELLLSSVFEGDAVGFEGDPFYNLVVGVDTSETVGELAQTLVKIEDERGRIRDTPRFSSRTLDLDLLTYADVAGLVDGVVLPRKEILESAFVLWPLSEIAGDELHPIAQRSYADLWRDFDKTAQQLWCVDFVWGEMWISGAGS